jgi:hypothetical protein
MPDQPPKTRNIIWHLSAAAEIDQLVWVECGYCRIRHHYEPRDLIRLLGDADVNKLARRMKCERCGRKDNMEADVYLPVAVERVSMTIRRLVEVKVRRVPVWQDVKPGGRR